jgi:hypothetical protein
VLPLFIYPYYNQRLQISQGKLFSFAATILTKIKCIIITVEHPKAWRDRYEKNVFYHDKEPAFVLYGFVSDRPFATAKE